MDNIKVSVIVPVYNVEQFLPKCLDSLVNQTLEEIEILVVNDGSPDNSQAIIDDYARRYPDKIRPFVKENGGLSDARNYGIARATGEYIGFVDSDDYVDLDMFEQMYQKAVTTGAQVVCCPLTNEYENKTQKTFYNEIFFGKNVRQSPKILTYANSVAPNKIYNRAFWQENAFQFPLRQWFEDSYLIYNVMLAANKVEVVNIPFMHYVRYREDSITNKFDMRVFDIFKSAESIVTYYKEHDAFDDIADELEYICLRHVTARVKSLRKAPDRETGLRFVTEMIALLDQHFPNWRKNRYVKASKKASLHAKLSKLMLRSELLLKVYVSAPQWVIVLLRSLVKAVKKLKKLRKQTPCYKAKKEKKAEKNKETKRYFIQHNGMAVLNEVQTILSELGITSFADFGTCLGLVREGALLKHDLDMDIGVIANPEDREKIRIALERRGFKLWRQYCYKGNPVEESYRYRRVKVDLNFYEMTEDYSRTWLFYAKPGHKYDNSWTRHVVQMTYSPIRGVKYEEFDGSMIALPEDPELLMTEKYGPNWRTPDTGWIYWESPAAEKLEEIGSFKTVSYKGSIHVNKEDEYAQRNEEQLRKIRGIQEEQLLALKEFVRVCDQLGLCYCLGEGSLLGAVRHNGIIPWDKNVNIWMERADYNRLIQEAPGVLAEQFVLQHGTVADTYYISGVKLRLVKGNVFFDKALAKHTEDNGPCIDIYPLDSVPFCSGKQLSKMKKQYNRCKTLLRYKHKQGKAKTWKQKLLRLYAALVSKEYLMNKMEQVCTAYNASESDYYVCLTSKHPVHKQVFAKELFAQPRYAMFEGMELPIPGEAEVILQKIYNNYKKPTPTFKRTLVTTFTTEEEEALKNAEAEQTQQEENP